MLRELILVLALTLSMVSWIYAQTIDSTGSNTAPIEQSSFNWKDRVFFGGNIGGGITNNQFVINIAPLVGLRITDRYSAGVQANYTYARISIPGYTLNDHVIGGSIFNRYFVWRDLFLHGEAEMLNANWTGTERSNIYNLMAGGGYLFRFGTNAGFGIMVLYNFLENPYKIRQNPVINMGFTFGL